MILNPKYKQMIIEALVQIANTTKSEMFCSIAAEPILRGSTAEDLLQFARTWQGDDFEECLQSVYDNRYPAQF
ncbi:MAG: hypothetical protein MUE44_05680 [Oscillatoriaceae cyanobacterium Prado104]|nr:hypothetical protein [Oscillatoriaceae cyanobacterium Prado104]